MSPALDPQPAADPAAVVPSLVVAAVDDALARFGGRSLVSGSEVVDVLLDLRRLAVFDDVVAGATRSSAT
jgi:hypothetical protein